MKNSKFSLFAVLFAITVLFIGCAPGFEPELKTYEFSELQNEDIFLVKLNRSDTVVPASHTGNSRNLYPQNQYSSSYNQSDRAIRRTSHPAATAFNANPPAITDSTPRITRSSFTPPALNSTRDFFVESFFNSGVFVSSTATLRATGNRGNIWVIGTSITTPQAQELSDKFDTIYDEITKIFGFEYGKYTGQTLNGKDEDPKIQILVYNIGNNIAGYFWGKDFYTQTELQQIGAGNLRTNNAEIFYIDAGLITHAESRVRNFAYLTLAHELQHMIHFNRKWVIHGRNSETWYNELLSKMAEDIIAPILSIDAPSYHMPWYLATYDLVGITDWDTSNDTLTDASYDKSYAFGAYLLRNYGGARLLESILSNNSVDIQSLNSALSQIAGISFEQAFRNFAQALIHYGISDPDNGPPSFNRSNTSNVGGTTYNLSRIDIWNMDRPGRSGYPGGKGTLIFNIAPTQMRPYSIMIQSTNAWRNLSGNFSITLELPRNASVELDLLRDSSRNW